MTWNSKPKGQCRFATCDKPANCGAKPPYDNMCHSCYDEYMEIKKQEDAFRKLK